jgi:hypothetical protein
MTFFISTSNLKKLVEGREIVRGGDDDTSEGVLIPFYLILASLKDKEYKYISSLNSESLFQIVKEKLCEDLIWLSQDKFMCFSEKYKTQFIFIFSNKVSQSEYFEHKKIPTNVRYIFVNKIGIFSYDIKNLPEPKWINGEGIFQSERGKEITHLIR